MYETTRELGRGGEGAVFEVAVFNNLVVKVYNDPPGPVLISKLKDMLTLKSPSIENYAAWPVDIVSDNNGKIVGFAMRKLTGFVPLHMVFSPMDRKKLFPDKGYNFLVHIARNVATAFHHLHNTGLVAGDVNEGNILINNNGMVAFIDCDSFQVKSSNGYHFCEVGVPRYTPPELLRLQSFGQVVRTSNTDAFSMAVLIFQLLMMGRHPFAGVNKSSADIDEETAIRQHYYAYNTVRKTPLQPPPDALKMAGFPQQVIELFNRSFLEEDNRPATAEWIQALDTLLATMVTCEKSGLHVYAETMQQCPWCQFRQKKGILYFLDEDNSNIGWTIDDLDDFINGFKPDDFEIRPWVGNLAFLHLKPHSMPAAIIRAQRIKRWVAVTTPILTLVLGFVQDGTDSIYSKLGVPVLLFFIFNKVLSLMVPFRKAIRDTEERHMRQKEQLDKLLHEYNESAEIIGYRRKLEQLKEQIKHYGSLQSEYNARKTIIEEEYYNRSLDEYLTAFPLANYEIPAIGNVRKTALLNAGIVTAADITKMVTVKVPGIGTKNYHVLLDWRRGLSGGFVYRPDVDGIQRSIEKLRNEMHDKKLKKGSSIRRDYQALNYMKININNRAAMLDASIKTQAMRTDQEAVNLKALMKERTKWF